MKHFQVLVSPLITEKAEGRKEADRTLCFKVQPEATKESNVREKAIATSL